MSSDNGILICKRYGRFEVRYFNASMDYESSDEMETLAIFENLEDAVKYGHNEVTEYGIYYEEA